MRATLGSGKSQKYQKSYVYVITDMLSVIGDLDSLIRYPIHTSEYSNRYDMSTTMVSIIVGAVGKHIKTVLSEHSTSVYRVMAESKLRPSLARESKTLNVFR